MNATTDGPAASADLSALIRTQCAEEIAELRRTTAERAAGIRNAALQESEALRAAARALGAERGRQAAAKRVAAAASDSRRAWLWSRERLLIEVLDAARDQLTAFPAIPDGHRILCALIAEALDVLPPGEVCVRVPASYAAALDPDTRAQLEAGRWRLSVTQEAAPAAGVIVESVDGRLRFDNSFEARIRRGGHRLRRAVLAALLGGEALEW